jgi:hypothetical protein
MAWTISGTRRGLVPNPGGANAFGGFELQTPYGDVKKQTQLNREAPISGLSARSSGDKCAEAGTEICNPPRTATDRRRGIRPAYSSTAPGCSECSIYLADLAGDRSRTRRVRPC